MCVAILHMFEIFTELDQTHIKPIKSEIFKALHQFPCEFSPFSEAVSTRKNGTLCYVQVTSKHKMVYDKIFHKVHVPFDVRCQKLQ